MRVILQENIANLGKVGDQVTVKAGYARNFLMPFGKAVVATKESIANFEQRRAELEKRAAEVLAQAQARADKMAEVNVTIEAQAGDEGKLYGSVGPRDIADAVAAQGHELSKSEVLMPEGPIRMVGEYDIDLSFHSEVTAKVKISIVQAK